jgi:hypothetical protein
MKYKLKIVPQDGGYVGYALLNDEIAFTTSFNKDVTAVSKELSVFASTNQPQAPVVVVANRSAGSVEVMRAPAPAAPAPSNPTPTASTSVPRKCCGRG